MPKRAILVLIGLPLTALWPAALPEGAAAQQVMRVQSVPPAWLGISYEVRWAQDDSRCEPQVLVERVIQGSPAARAGLQPGDAIIALDGAPVPASRLAAFATRLEPGDSVRLTLSRDGQTRDVLAIAERRPARPPAAVLRPAPGRAGPTSAPIVHLDGETLVARNLDGGPSGASGYWFATSDGRTEFRRLGAWARDDMDVRVTRLLQCASEAAARPPAGRLDLRQVQQRADSLRIVIARRALEHQEGPGFELRARRLTMTPTVSDVAGADVTPLEPELAEYFRNARRGLLVLRVASNTAAARGGLVPGDVIVHGNGRPVESAQALQALLATPGPQPVQLRVVRKGRTMTVTLPLP